MKALPAVDRVCVHTYLPGDLRAGGVVLDLGANRGDFAEAIASRFECDVHAMEPVPAFHETLEALSGVDLHPLCLAPREGMVELHVPEEKDATLFPDSGTSATSIEVPATTIEGFMDAVGASEFELVKLDVEGAELPALEEAPARSLLRARQITVEFHDWQRPENEDRVRLVKRRLRRIGFYCIRFSANNGDVLFVRRDLLSPLQYYYLALCVRNVRGVGRVLRRGVERLLTDSCLIGVL